jgi:hypothetical protein
MSNRPARIRQAEIERAIRAAKKNGATAVELKISEQVSIRISLVPDKGLGESQEVLAESQEVVL